MKKRTFLAVFLIVVVLAVVGGLNAWALSAPETRSAPAAAVTVDEGEAFIRHGGGSWEPVAADAQVAVGDQVKTNVKSQATINFFDGASARLDENSEVVVRELTVDADNHALTRVDLGVTAGRVWSRIIKLMDRDAAYSVQSSSVVATVRGTAFVTDVTNPAGDVVQVVDGVVGVARMPDTLSEPKWEDVRAGEEAWMDKKGGRAAAAAVQRRAMTEKFRTSAWYRKNVAADDRFLEFVKQKREQQLSTMGRVLPGAPRYGLMRFGERLRAALTTDAAARRELLLQYQGRRFAEAVLLARAGKTAAMERAWNGYLDGFRAMQRDMGNGRAAPQESRAAVKRMIGRITEHRQLIAALDGGAVAVPETIRARMIGDRADTETIIAALEASFPDAVAPSSPQTFSPLEATPAEPVATSTPETPVVTNGNTNTNQPVPAPTNTNQPTAATPVSLAVTGTRNIMNVPDSQQFRAVLTMSDGTRSDVTTQAVWTLLGDPVGELVRGNLMTSAAGNATVQAVAMGLTGTYAVRVLPPAQLATLQSLVVSPAQPTVKSGARQTFIATASYSDGTTKDVTSLTTWSLSSSALGTLAGNVFTATSSLTFGGVVSLTAQYAEAGQTATGTATINVVP